MKKSIGKVFIGLSGGVDSSVAAYLLKQATPNNFEKLFGRPTPKRFRGYDVTGVFIRSYNVDGCAERDAEDARRAAAHLGIPFYVFDFEKEYKKEVVEYMVNGYRNGLTPNPDVMCNKEIKFGLFLKKALEMGADYVATGHYVRLKRMRIMNKELRIKKFSNPSFMIHHSLFIARDSAKDQSYFLWTLTQEQLKHCIFPVGDYLKPEVREIARKAGLPTAEKKDSQGICFLGDIELDDFLKDYIKPKKGPIVDTDGNKIGEHMGAQFYTIGQRHLGAKFQIPNSKFQKPFYVVSKDVKTNTIVVAEGDDNPALFRKEAEIANLNFIETIPNAPAQGVSGATPKSYPSREHWVSLKVMARVRYRQPLMKARIMDNESGINSRSITHNSNSLILKFDHPVKFVAPGQSAVFYEAGFFAGLRGRKMLGGGIIL